MSDRGPRGPGRHHCPEAGPDAEPAQQRLAATALRRSGWKFRKHWLRLADRSVASLRASRDSPESPRRERRNRRMRPASAGPVVMVRAGEDSAYVAGRECQWRRQRKLPLVDKRLCQGGPSSAADLHPRGRNDGPGVGTRRERPSSRGAAHMRWVPAPGRAEPCSQPQALGADRLVAVVRRASPEAPAADPGGGFRWRRIWRWQWPGRPP